MNATYTKLKDGWGIRVTGGVPQAGDQITVRTKAGKVKTETVAKVIWTGDDKYQPGVKVALCATKQTARPYINRVINEGGRGDQGWRNNGCSDCRQLGDWCKRCAFDEFDN